MTSSWAADIIDYWFDHLGSAYWFKPNEDVDAESRDRCESLWNAMRKEAAIFFLTDPKEALAAILLFDQFPRKLQPLGQTIRNDFLCIAKCLGIFCHPPYCEREV